MIDNEDYDDFEVDFEEEWPEIAEENERLLDLFRNAMRLLPDGEVEAHIARVRLFLFDYFHESTNSNIYDGCDDIPYFFDYLIDNHICRTTASIKRMTESIWRFYRAMYECGEICDLDYVDVCDSLMGRDELIKSCREANPDIEDEDIDAEGEYDDDFFVKCLRQLSEERFGGGQE
jgi:hypothetical protein